MKKFTLNLVTIIATLSLIVSFTNDVFAQGSLTKGYEMTETRATLLEEGFDMDWLPAGWSVINFHPSQNWMQSNPANNNFNTIDPGSLFSAICPWIGDDQDEWLISPEINGADDANTTLKFYAGASGSWLSEATLRCLISTNGGDSWTEIWNAIDEISPGAEWNWHEVILPIEVNVGEDLFMIAWNYVGSDGDLVGVDGVKIYNGTTGIINITNWLSFSIYPNPFTTSTTIEYELTQPKTVTITFYNQFGKVVDVIEERQPKGLNKLIWTPKNLADGIYYYRLQVGEQIANGKMLLMR